MGSKFHSELHTREGVNYLKLGGVIDEDNDLAALEAQAAERGLRLDHASWKS